MTVFCGMALGALPLSSFARAPASRELVAAGTHNVGIFERRPNGEFSGLGVELMRLLAHRHGYQARFEIYPWRRAMEVVSGGKADILVGAYKSAERQRILRFGEQAFLQDELAFYVRADSMPVWEGDYSLLKGRRVALINGWLYGQAFDKALPQLRASVTNTVENGLQMLAHGHVELFATNRRDTDPVLAALGLQDKLMALAPLIDVQDAYFAYPLSPRLRDLPAHFDQLLVEMKKNGALQKLARRYGVTIP
ncbi:transporter substrate-binding domain-containing protein [Pseudoduganella sp. FT26W]|uniref:Transporter substrate-binding domain-containing protein n=1 Tax=Duganella aquatilis TaxID=2666082 RepID=A0A844D6X0_9BURK|nr:transporter substrate-binding domain-containing protein [Duganella aquatilis]MRW82959.1 transporter substrate-binding domain-containing protein [Duganella aquatilis]